MGFFDDLENEVQRPDADSHEPKMLVGDYGPVLERLRSGWTHRIERQKPDQERDKAMQLQEVEITWMPSRERYSWSNRLVEVFGKRRGRVMDESVRYLDEESLLDAMQQAPWVGVSALEAAGVDRSRPDF